MKKGIIVLIATLAVLLAQVVAPAGEALAAGVSRKDYTLQVKVMDEDGAILAGASVYLYGTEMDSEGSYPLLWSGKTDNAGYADVAITDISYDGVHPQQQYSLKIAAPGRLPVTHDFTIDVWDSSTKTLKVAGPAQLSFKMKKADTELGRMIASAVGSTPTEAAVQGGITPMYMVDVRQVGTTENLGTQKLRLAYMDNAEGTNTTLEFVWVTRFDFGVNVGLKFTKKSGQWQSQPLWEVGSSVNYSWQDQTSYEHKWVRTGSQTDPIWACALGTVHSSWWQQLTYMPVNDDYWDWVVTDEWQEVKVVSVSNWSTVWDSSDTEPHYFSANGEMVDAGTSSAGAWNTTTSWVFGVDLRWKWAGCTLNVTTKKSTTTSMRIDNIAGTKTVYIYTTPEFKWFKLSANP